MKTIEERAKEWGEHIVETTPYDVVNGKACVFVEDRNIADVAEESYIAGATEQKAIDDKANYQQGYHDATKKACKWIKENFEYYTDVEVSSYYIYDDKFIEDFRKAMEE